MFANSKVQWPSLGFWPGFKSLATDPGNEFDAPYKTMGDIALPGGASIPFPATFDLSGSVSIGGFEVPYIALLGGGIALALVFAGKKGGAAVRRRRASSAGKSAKVAQAKADLRRAQAA